MLVIMLCVVGAALFGIGVYTVIMIIKKFKHPGIEHTYTERNKMATDNMNYTKTNNADNFNTAGKIDVDEAELQVQYDPNNPKEFSSVFNRS